MKIAEYMKEKLTYLSPEPLSESWICKEVLVPGFLKLIENPNLEQYIPEFGSFFQSKILPYLLQKDDSNTLLLNFTLPSNFPPQVNPSTRTMEKRVTIDNPVIPKLDHCVSCFRSWTVCKTGTSCHRDSTKRPNRKI